MKHNTKLFGLLLCVFPIMGVAQDRWVTDFTNETQNYASQICSISDRGRGYCFEVACNKNGETFFALNIPDATMTPGARNRIDIWVDSVSYGWFEMWVSERGMALLAKMDAVSTENIKTLLRQGNNVTLQWETDVGTERFQFTLAGSSAALSRTEATCSRLTSVVVAGAISDENGIPEPDSNNLPAVIDWVMETNGCTATESQIYDAIASRSDHWTANIVIVNWSESSDFQDNYRSRRRDDGKFEYSKISGSRCQQ